MACLIELLPPPDPPTTLPLTPHPHTPYAHPHRTTILPPPPPPNRVNCRLHDDMRLRHPNDRQGLGVYDTNLSHYGFVCRHNGVVPLNWPFPDVSGELAFCVCVCVAFFFFFFFFFFFVGGGWVGGTVRVRQPSRGHAVSFLPTSFFFSFLF